MKFSQIELLEARIAPATLSIAPAAVAEGNAGTNTLTFTVTLSEVTNNDVTVNFATKDGTATSTGTYADYVAKSGSLTIVAGELTGTIEVTVNGDDYAEADETFEVELTNPVNADFDGGNTTISAIGTIQDDGDAAVGGAVIGDVSKVEGSSNSTINFTVAFTQALASDFTLTYWTQNGTAAAGSDFIKASGTITVAAGQTTATIPITIIGDSSYETVESFYLNVSGLPGTIPLENEHFVTPAAQLTGRAYILDDDLGAAGPQELRWTDIDGDLVTLKTSKGSFLNSLGGLNTEVVTLVSKGSVGGSELLLLNLNSSMFAGANITITAEKQVGFPDASNGRVDVGFIQAATFLTSELQAIGVDLGVVTVDGDLAKITAGDIYSTPAIRKLDVYSLGVNATTLEGLNDSFKNTQSDVLGPITTINVKTDVAGFLHVLGAEFGTIGSLTIGGALKGGATDNSGRVTASGKIVKSTIGSIIGGAGVNSGLLSGTNLTNGVLGTVTVLGDVIGGSGDSSGSIFSSLNLASVTIKGDVIGGTGSGSGGIVAGATIGKLLIDGDLVGGDSTSAAFVDRSGFIYAGALPSVTIGGSVKAGQDTGGLGLATSGSIRADVIGNLLIEGDVIGHTSTGTDDASVPVIISASGLNNLLAIKSVKILGNVSNAEILAGYTPNGTALSTTGAIQRGTAINGDASIGTVDIGGDVTALNIVAGAQAGSSGRFGVSTNTMIAAVSGTSLNDPFVFSSIASVILRGTITTNADYFGIVAQSIGSVSYGTPSTVVTLLPGPSNDTTPVEIGSTGSKFQAIELPII